ncbi:MAG: trypsin-like serine peptidase [Paracoccaceae bacterium]
MFSRFSTAALCTAALALGAAPGAAQDGYRMDVPDLPALDLNAMARGFVPPPEADLRVPSEDAPQGQGAVQGEPDFMRLATLPADHPLRRLSEKVGQLFYISRDQKVTPYCSGTLVGPKLFLTSQHCVSSVADGARASPISLAVSVGHYDEGRYYAAEAQVSRVSAILKEDWFLDYALLMLAEPLGERFGWVRLETDPKAVDAARAVKIIQHPSGRAKEAVVENTRVLSSQWPFIHYLADTEEVGSDGAPVFDLEGETLIALHRTGTQSYNEGVRAPRIAYEIALYLPEDSRPPAAAAAVPEGERTSSAPAPGPEAPAASASDGFPAVGSGPANISDMLR